MSGCILQQKSVRANEIACSKHVIEFRVVMVEFVYRILVFHEAVTFELARP